MHRTDQAKLQQAVKQLQRGDATALEKLQKLHQLHPHSAEILYWLGNGLRLQGQVKEAELTLAQALSLQPNHLHAGLSLVFLLLGEDRLEEAVEMLTRLGQRLQKDKPALLKIVSQLRQLDAIDPAAALLSSYCDAHPNDPQTRFLLGRLQQSVGAFDQAADQYRGALALNPNQSSAWLRLARIQRFKTADDQDFRLIKRMIDRPELSADTRICLQFALAKAADDVGDYPLAYDCLRRGNQAQAQRVQWSDRAWQEWVAGQCGGFDQTFYTSMKSRRLSEAQPILIVGMLRSGTTLLEQILDRHTHLTGRGELTDVSRWVRTALGDNPLVVESLSKQDLRQFVAQYCHSLGQADGDGPRGMDKAPLNFRYLGLLAALFPRAKIIHCRRDARDVALSLYSQLFQHRDNNYSYRRRDITGFYRGYRRLMAHWQTLLGERIIQLHYADLIQRPEDTLRQLLTDLDLGWESGLLQPSNSRRVIHTASTWQARQGLYTSSLNRWRHYQELAAAWFKQLEAEDQALS